MARRRRSPYRLLILLACVAVFFAFRYGYEQWFGENGPPPADLTPGPYAVVRVVDGDTLILRKNDAAEEDAFRVRLLGIDTPETVKPDHPVEPFGPEATEFAKQFLAGGTVRLEFDRRRLDDYDRVLAYVYVDDKMLNEELLRAGLARLDHYPGDSDAKLRLFRKAETAAKEASLGLWSQDVEVASP